MSKACIAAKPLQRSSLPNTIGDAVRAPKLLDFYKARSRFHSLRLRDSGNGDDTSSIAEVHPSSITHDVGETSRGCTLFFQPRSLAPLPLIL